MVQISKIQKKLREAKFFFRHVCDKNRALNLESEELEFFLSAFLSAGRSVIGFFCEKQNKQYRPWFREWRMALTGGDRKLLNEMTRQRDSEVHEQGTEVHAAVEMVPLTEIRMGAQAHIAYGFDGPPGTPPAQIGQKVYYFEIGGCKEEVIGTCKRYVELLEKLVQEFDRAAAGT
jgi:hypothetical protein